ncbi:MAG: hypothetical protein DHS20C16_16880 [Phycisphaerae bacterium]|nr:MAG: hypothetical protein DHS20C16_16880 [Phycisphaerae bacterium]
MVMSFLLRGVVAPAAILVVLTLIGNRFWRLKDERQADPLPALACGIALTVGFIRMFKWPGVPPTEHWQWILVAIWGATVAAFLASWMTRTHILRLIVWLVFASATAWLIHPTWDDYAGERWWLIGGVAAIIFANLEATSHLNRERHGLSPLFMVTIGMILTSILVVHANQAKFAQVCGSIAAVLGFLFLICLRLPKREPISGAMAIPSIMIPVMAFLAFYFYSDGETFPTEFALGSVTPLMVAVVTLCPMGRLKGWKRFVVAQILCIIPVVVGIVMLVKSSGAEESYAY